MKKLITAVAMTASLGFLTAAQADDPTLGEILLADTSGFDANQTDFDIVTAAILACANNEDSVVGPAALDAEATLTAFLPTDKAFRILVEDVYGISIKDEAELFGAIAVTLGCETINEVLEYHVVANIAADSSIVAGLENGTSLMTVQGASFTVGFRGKGQIRLADNEPMLRDPIVVKTDIFASNGVAHVIDRVLLPVALIEE